VTPVWQSWVFLFEVALVLAVCAVWAGQRYRNDRLALRKRVLVNLLDGKAMDGVLYSRRGRLLVLRDVTVLEQGAQPVSVDGEVLVDRNRVDFVQVTDR